MQGFGFWGSRFYRAQGLSFPKASLGMGPTYVFKHGLEFWVPSPKQGLCKGFVLCVLWTPIGYAKARSPRIRLMEDNLHHFSPLTTRIRGIVVLKGLPPSTVLIPTAGRKANTHCLQGGQTSTGCFAYGVARVLQLVQAHVGACPTRFQKSPCCSAPGRVKPNTQNRFKRQKFCSSSLASIRAVHRSNDHRQCKSHDNCHSFWRERPLACNT